MDLPFERIWEILNFHPNVIIVFLITVQILVQGRNGIQSEKGGGGGGGGGGVPWKSQVAINFLKNSDMDHTREAIALSCLRIHPFFTPLSNERP